MDEGFFLDSQRLDKGHPIFVLFKIAFHLTHTGLLLSAKHIKTKTLPKSEGPGTAAPGPFGPKGYIRPATFLAPILAPQLRLSIPTFRSKRPINGALCFRYCLGLRRGSASFRMVRVERDRPFPDMPPGTLNDAVLDSAIFHADLRTCGVARLSRVSIPSGIAHSREGRCYCPW